MNERLDQQLVYRQSQRNARYCPIRFGLHMELFDELIRQVALSDSTRAFILERVRGELNQTLDSYKKVLEVSLVEEAKVVVDQKVDPEVMILQRKLDDAQAELAVVVEDHENVNSDLKELENKFELMERIEIQVHQPEIAFTKRLGQALERQLYHFDNPPVFDTGEDE
ncbi:33 kDa inner dynein arm light chain, axonemal [Folsomia candida]|nr:33 kDa inner dynein arm light chain, axonemal [Folsomia candida]